MAVVQIEKQRPDRGAERAARRHAVGRLGAETAAAGGTTPAEQLDARHQRRDRRDVDVIVAMATGLPLPRDVGSAVRARGGQPFDRLVRRVAERPRRARARWPRLAPLALLARRCPARLLVLRRRRCGYSARSSSASPAAPRVRRSASPAARSTPPARVSSASFSRSLRRYRNGGVIHTLTHIQPARATRKCQPGEQLRFIVPHLQCAVVVWLLHQGTWVRALPANLTQPPALLDIAPNVMILKKSTYEVLAVRLQISRPSRILMRFEASVERPPKCQVIRYSRTRHPPLVDRLGVTAGRKSSRGRREHRSVSRSIRQRSITSSKLSILSGGIVLQAAPIRQKPIPAR